MPRLPATGDRIIAFLNMSRGTNARGRNDVLCHQKVNECHYIIYVGGHHSNKGTRFPDDALDER